MLRTAAVIALLAAALAAPAHAQTTSCADDVKKAQSSPELRVQGGGNHAVSARANATLYLQQAADAAARNDEQHCREFLDRAKLALTY